MPQFPQASQLSLPCRFAQVVPGALHADGRRYLPLLIFSLPGGLQLGVVDRHHRVDLTQAGREGSAQLVFLLSTIRMQQGEHRAGLQAEPDLGGRPSTQPTASGRVLAVPSWETEKEHLPYEMMYTELLLDVGLGVIGVRTHMTAQRLDEALGKPQLAAGDWIDVGRSRIDILAFLPSAGG